MARELVPGLNRQILGGGSQTSGEVAPGHLLVVRRATTMYLCRLSVLGVRNQVLIAQVSEMSSKIFLNPP